MPNATDDYKYQFLVGAAGVNNTLPDEHISDQELSDARNVIPDNTGTGGLVKRCGVKAQSTGDAYPANTSMWTNIYTAYCGKNGNYYTEGYSTSTPANVFNIYKISDGTVLATNSNVPAYNPSWCTFAGYDIYADGTQYKKTSNGTTFTDVANVPTSTMVLEPYNNYLFSIANGSTALRWTTADDPEAWDATHTLPFVLQDRNDFLVAARWHGTELYVWTKKRYYIIVGYGPLDFSVVFNNKWLGAARQALTLSTPFGLFWWSDAYGLIRSENGRSIDFPMQRKLAKTFQSVKQYTPDYGSMIYRPERLCLSIYCNLNALSTVNTDLRIDYYPMTDQFWVHDDDASSCLAAAYLDGIGTGAYSGGSVFLVNANQVATTGKLYCRTEDETLFTDLGSAFDTYIETKRKAETPNTVRHARNAMLTTNFGTSGDLTYSYYANNATSVTESKTVTPAAGVDDNPISVNAECTKIKHRLADSLTTVTRYYSLIEVGSIEKEK